MITGVEVKKMSILHPEYSIELRGTMNALIDRLVLQRSKGLNTLYHYTPSFEAVNGIMQNRQIWLTNIAYLNDVAELDYIKSLLNELGLCTEIREHLSKWQPISAGFGTQIYVMSFSEKPDYLPLWATFTKMSGYCVGFDRLGLCSSVLSKTRLNIEAVRNTAVSYETIMLQASGDKGSPDFQGAYGGEMYLGRVIYEKSVQIEIMNTVIKQAIDKFIAISESPDKNLAQNVAIINGKEIGRVKKDRLALENAINKLFDQCAVLFKSDEFSYEHEWRLVKHMDTNNPNLLRSLFFVRENDNTLIPFVKMSLRNNLSFPINRIITAPLAISDTILPGLEFALYNSGYNIGENGVAIEKSKINLRRF